MRRCLDCGMLVERGSRCVVCASLKRVPPGWSDAVKRRDGYRCVVCGSTLGVEADHIVPRARGGAHTLDNGRTLCRAHHLEAHRA